MTLVSVVVCVYDGGRFDVFEECIDSVLAQTHEPLELVVVVDGSRPLYERVDDALDGAADGIDRRVVVLNEENCGVSYSRTRGARVAAGDVVAFIDDDGVAEPDWIERHVETYDERGAVATAGPVEPDWLSGRPSFFPEEFNWLVGCTEPGFAEDGDVLRNGYGSNVTYDREVFVDVGGYDANTGRKGDRHIQAHEAPAGVRMREEHDEGVVYVGDAVVRHRLFDYRGRPRWLLARSFWQGYSKRVMEVLYPGAQGDEREYLRMLVARSIPDRALGLLRSPSMSGAMQLLSIFAFTGAVGAGYAYALLRPERALLRDTDDDGTG